MLLNFEKINNKKEKELEKLVNEKSDKIKEMKKQKKESIQKQEKIQEEKEIKFIYNSKRDQYLQNVYLFSFDNFSEYYQENLRATINREQEDDRENFSKVKSNNRMLKR